MIGRYLLDTRPACYLMNKKNAALDRHLTRVPVVELGISAVTEGELRYGAASKGSAPPPPALENLVLMVTILPWNQAAAVEYGRLRADLERAGRVLGSLDTMITAHAMASGTTLVTADRAFTPIKNLKTEDWTR